MVNEYPIYNISFLVVIFQNDIYLRINKAKKIILFIYIVKMIYYVSSWIY